MHKFTNFVVIINTSPGWAGKISHLLLKCHHILLSLLISPINIRLETTKINNVLRLICINYIILNEAANYNIDKVSTTKMATHLLAKLWLKSERSLSSNGILLTQVRVVGNKHNNFNNSHRIRLG